MKLNFNELHKISLFALTMNGAHPFIKKDRYWAVKFFVQHGSFTFLFCMMLYSIIFHDLRHGDFTQACANGIISVLYLVVTFKYIMMLIHQNLLKDTIKTMKMDYEVAQALPFEDQELLLHFAARGKWVTELWLVTASITAGLFPVKSIILMIYYYMSGEFKLVPVYEMTYPGVINEIKENIIVFVVFYVIMVIYAGYAMCMYIGLVPMGPIFMLHASGQLALVKRRLLTLYPDTDTEYDSDATLDKLRDIVVRLQNIHRFVAMIKTTFQLIYELTLKGTIITLPITSYQVLQTFQNGQISMEFITIIFGCIILTACPCYYSNLLMETGEEVRQAIYACGWERHWDRRARSTGLIVMVFMSRPIAIKSMFGVVCLEALTDVYRQAFAIFNVINAAWT